MLNIGLFVLFTCLSLTHSSDALKKCGLNVTKGKGVCVPFSQCPQAEISAECGFSDGCCYSLQNNLDYYEFRGVWISTVANIDWPSSRTLTTAQQQQELINILDTLKSVGINAVVFQVRPAGDSMYASAIEPWSYYLTGQQGKAPSPQWDPLQFIVQQAHARDIDVHAWINPLRARNKGETYAFAPNHMTVRFPQYTYNYSGYIWMDPGSTDVQNHILSVVEDIVRRYDIDGLHIDDYFYPYPDSTVAFPDSAVYNAYVNAGGTLSLADWRRDNINRLVRNMYNRIKSVKPLVQFGISPFGIWRPGNPPGIVGFDPYSQIYADSKNWLQNGWLDYLTPQLYWQIDPPAQSFPNLLKWWCEQNTKNKLIFAGTALYKMVDQNWPSSEISRQIDITRSYRNISSFGATHFTTNYIMKNTKDIRGIFAAYYAQPALTPFLRL